MVRLNSGTQFLNHIHRIAVCVFLAEILLVVASCRVGTSVVAATGTTIGVELSQSQTSQAPTAVLGYKRAELAYVPTNRGCPEKTTVKYPIRLFEEPLEASGESRATPEEPGPPPDIDLQDL